VPRNVIDCARSISIALPPGYQQRDVLAFHARDKEGCAEQMIPGSILTPALKPALQRNSRVESQPDPAPASEAGPTRIRKGMLLRGVAVVVDIALHDQHAICTLQADGALPAGAIEKARAALPGMLGLRIAPEPFLALASSDTLLGPLVRNQPGLRIVQAASIFEAVSWAIIGQQINLSFAIALRRTLIQQAGRPHSSGLCCYPEACDVARLNLDALTSRKFSRAKADTLLRIARLTESGQLDLSLAPDQIAPALLAIKGIGPWSVNYTLLRGYGAADCSLHGDGAVRLALQRLKGAAEKPAIACAQAMLERYRPHRSMAAAHLWASLHPAARSE
jgi:DNA-3-methyladenine glycosylase II